MRAGHGGVGAALVVASLALAGCTGGGSQASGAAGQNFVAPGSAITIVAPDKRTMPGALSGTTIDGGTVDITQDRGHVLVLNVWGSWCAPCQKEAPDLQKASRELAGQGVRFLGIDTGEDGNRDAAAAFQRAYGITYPSLFDNGEYLLALRGAVAANGIPSTVILDEQGRVAARISGATTKDTLVDVVHDVIAGRVRAS